MNRYDVLRHLVQHGPGRNQPEIDALLAAIGKAEDAAAAPAPEPEPEVKPTPKGSLT